MRKKAGVYCHYDLAIRRDNKVQHQVTHGSDRFARRCNTPPIGQISSTSKALGKLCCLPAWMRLSRRRYFRASRSLAVLRLAGNGGEDEKQRRKQYRTKG